MVNLAGTFSQIDKKNILVVGDFLLDTYTMGKAKRISPEAPVAIVHVEKEDSRPGGAGNVVLNLLSLGQNVKAIGRIGNDEQGKLLKDLLEKEGTDVSPIYTQNHYPTPVKNRVIAENQQIVRIDHEEIVEINQEIEKEIIESIPSFVENIDVIALSDYGKGFLSDKLIAAFIAYGNKKKIPVIVDPKGEIFDKYKQAFLIKPNLSEAIKASRLPSKAALQDVGEELLKITKAKIVMITKGSEGLSLFLEDGKRFDFPVQIREVKDVTGAGDTVLAMLTCCLANQISLKESAMFCNIAGSFAVEHLGCVRISLNDLARSLLAYDVHNKVFDEDHLFALKKALEGKKKILLFLKEDECFQKQVFLEIRKFKQGKEAFLLLCLEEADSESVDCISSLQEIDFIILQKQKMENLLQLLEPDKAYFFDHQKIQEINIEDPLLV